MSKIKQLITKYRLQEAELNNNSEAVNKDKSALAEFKPSVSINVSLQTFLLVNASAHRIKRVFYMTRA